MKKELKIKPIPFYLDDALMPLYKSGLVVAFLLGFSSIFVSMGFSIFTYASCDISFSQACYEGFILFVKGISITAVIGFISFLAFWKRHQINFENCQQQGSHNCYELGLFRFA